MPTTTTTVVPLAQRLRLNYVNTGAGLSHLLAVIGGILCIGLIGNAYHRGTYYHAECDDAQEKRYNSLSDEEKEDSGSCEALVFGSYEQCQLFDKSRTFQSNYNYHMICPNKWLVVVPFFIIVVVGLTSLISLITLSLWEGAPKHLALIVNILCAVFMGASVLSLYGSIHGMAIGSLLYPRCLYQDENGEHYIAGEGSCRSNQTYKYWLVFYGMLTALLITIALSAAAKLRRDQTRRVDQAARNAAAVGRPVQYPTNRPVIAVPVSV